jgi:diguanylate cyclase (GGDEF)-like protein
MNPIPAPTPAPAPSLTSALRELWALYTRGLRFDPDMERRFAQACAPARMRHLMNTGAASLILFNLFLISDSYMIPDVFELSVMLRLYILTPVILGVVAFGHALRGWWLRTTPPWLTDVIAMLGTMAVAACLGVVLLTTQSAQVSVYRAGLIPVLVFGNLVQRLRFERAVMASAFTIGMFVYTALARSGEVRPYGLIEAPMGMLVIAVAIYTLVSNYNLEMAERQRFLQNERGLSLRTELERTRLGLEALSAIDPLTGLPNRRRFDSHVREHAAAGPMTLLLIDVDHFKAFNDHYGHAAGDQCLRLVARALQAALSHDQGLVARWGGEEFIVVLPDSNPARALAQAELMRKAVMRLAMRHEASSASDHVSVSIGVAEPALVRDEAAIDRLIRQADAALYQAKQQGRNRCVLTQVAEA